MEGLISVGRARRRTTLVPFWVLLYYVKRWFWPWCMMEDGDLGIY